MKRYAAGTRVETGYYLSTSHLAFTNIGPQAGVLDGEAGERYVRVPFGLALLAAPVAGLLFVILLPLIGVALTVGVIGKKLAQKVRGGAAQVAAVVQPPMATGAAYLTGEKPAKEPGAKAPEHPELDELAREVGERRGEKK
jgi:hypothetical protein